MRQAIKLFILSLVLLTACAQAPTLDNSTAESKTGAFLASVSTDPGTAYAGASARFQSSMTLDELKTFVDESTLKNFNSFTITGISYQQGVGVNAAKVDGDIIFTDLTKQNASFIWTYDNAKKDWYLDAFKFN
jgi:hypothetical protein